MLENHNKFLKQQHSYLAGTPYACQLASVKGN